MRSQLFVKTIDLHSNPSNFEIGIVIRYANWYIVYNSCGQRIGCLNEIDHHLTFLSYFYYTKGSIFVECTDGNVYEYNYKFELLKREKITVDFFDKLQETGVLTNNEIRFNDFVLHHLFYESMFDYFELLAKYKTELNEMKLTQLFNELVFIDFLAMKNLLKVEFTANLVPNKFIKHVTSEIKLTLETGQRTIPFSSMSEFAFYFLTQLPIFQTLKFNNN